MFLLVRHPNRDLDISCSFVEKPGDQFCLKTKTEGVGSPPHHIMPKMQRGAIIVSDPMTTDEVNDESVQLRDAVSKSRPSLDLDQIRDDHVCLAQMTKYRDKRFPGFRIVSADQFVIETSSNERTVHIGRRQPNVFLISVEHKREFRIGFAV